MDKRSFLLFLLGLGFVHSCDNFGYGYVVFSNGGAKCLEGDSPPRKPKNQVADLFGAFSLVPLRWFLSLPENSQCRIHMSEVSQEADKLSSWALKMLDASAKLPAGVLSGNLNQFGDFDECISSKRDTEKGLIQGKYCMANIGIKFHSNKTNELDSAIHSNWLLHNEFRDEGHRIPKFETFNFGLCIPASCDTKEMETALDKQLNQLSRKNVANFQVSITEDVCYVQTEAPASMTKSIVWLLFLLIAASTILGSLADWEKIKIKNRILVCFSLKRNLASLLKTSSPPDDIKCLHGARFLNAVALLLSHKQIAMLFSPTTNRTQMSESFSEGWTMIGRAAILYTDSFILISGLLISYSIVNDLDGKKRINFKEKIINRIVRLLPNLIGVILFCTYIMDEISSGPQWGLVVSKYTNLCKKHMWRNFLFIHNYFGFENMCLTHTHQLGIDMQLFLVSPIFIYVIWKMPKIGTLLLTIVSGVSTWLRYDATHRENLSTILYYGISVERLWKTANNSYIMPTHRLTVYLMGIMLGYYLRRGGRNLNLTTSQAAVGWILALGAGFLSVFGPYRAAFKEYTYDVNDAARFNAFAPVLWSVFVSWCILACANGYGGKFGEFCNWRYFVVFTRISYAVYLTQFPVFFYNVGTQRTAQYFKGFHSLFDVEELSVIFIASVVLTLMFDIPFQELKKALALVFKTSKGTDEETETKENAGQKGRKRLQYLGT